MIVENPPAPDEDGQVLTMDDHTDASEDDDLPPP